MERRVDLMSLEREEEIVRNQRRFSWISTITLGALFGAAAWYGSNELSKQAGVVEKFPALNDLVTSVGNRVSRAESRIQEWAIEKDGIFSRLQSLERSLEAKMALAAQKARQAGESAAIQTRTEMDRRAQLADSRLEKLEAAHQAGRQDLAGLRTELAQVKQSIEQQESRMLASEKNGYSDREFAMQRIDSVQKQMRQSEGETRGEVHKLARSIANDRIDFEVSRNRNRQLAPGVSMTVTGIDVAHRKINGWMWVMPDRKTIWLRDHGAMQPVVFYSSIDGKRREMVFTHVTRDAAVGYLLLPAVRTEMAQVEPGGRNQPPGQ